MQAPQSPTSSAPANAVALRRMRLDDLPRTLVVERAAYPWPWTEDIFRDSLRAGHLALVLEQAGEIFGHAVQLVAADECQILNLCVHPRRQGQGYGRLLLRRLLALARQRGAANAFLEVRCSNRAAIALYRGEDFHDVGLRRGYYPAAHGREDALIMARAL